MCRRSEEQELVDAPERVTSLALETWNWDATSTIYNDAASGLIWVENQVSLKASETIMGKEHFEQWLYDTACAEVKHFHGNNGIFSSEEYHLECSEKKQLQSFLGVGVQHQNSKA